MSRDLTGAPMTVLKLCCEKVLETGRMELVDSQSILQQAQALGVCEESFYDALEQLHQQGYIRPYTVNRHRIRHFAVTFDCFQSYGKAHIQNYDDLIQAVAYEIAANNRTDIWTVAHELHQPPVVVEHFLEALERMALIKLERSTTGPVVSYVSAYLKQAVS